METKPADVHEHYRMIHGAVQACHGYSWQLTAIYVPAIGAGIYMLAKGETGVRLSIVLGGLLIGLTLYWYLNQVALDQFNDARYDFLKKLEAELFPGDRAWMAYYTVVRRKKWWCTDFRILRAVILVGYVVAIALVIMARMFGWK